ncbi:unnamed protein product [Durusdinium trenchii]|uniref:Uncharacterized protein n=1 Tax=Durusdinium trenchii TaxID=1381693 RepID=A0ABP0IHP3_9DINO
MVTWMRFILLLQLMTSKELEQAKNVDDVFQPSSRVFRLFSFFALHRVHFEEVVHPFMDCHKVDEQGQPLTLMGAVTYKTLEKAQTWALEFNRYLESPSIAAKLKEQAPQELRADFQKELDAFYDFFKVEVVSAIRRVALAPSFWSFFAFCRESIKECQLVGVEDDEAGTEVELKIVEPLFRLFVNGIILPILRAPKKYGGREVGLRRCEKNNFDGDVIFNVCTVLDAFEDMTNKVSSKRLNKIGSRLRPEILRFLLDRISPDSTSTDDPDTTVTVQTFVSHYDRTPRSVYVPPSQLILFQNLVLHNVNKIRVQSGDLLDQACRKIGWWSEQFVKEAMERAEKNTEVLYRLTLQHRFFFTEGSLSICPASKCTVPLSLSSAAGSEALQRSEVALAQNVDVIRFLKEDNPNKVLEDLFRNLPPLKSSNFLDLKEELEGILKVCANEALAEKLSEERQSKIRVIDHQAWAAAAGKQLHYAIAKDRISSFAATAHAAQGQTYKEGVVMDMRIGEAGDPLTAYIALTRVRNRVCKECIQRHVNTGKPWQCMACKARLKSDMHGFGRQGCGAPALAGKAAVQACGMRPQSLVMGIQAVADFIETETSPEEVLHAMASVILTRNRHSRYLHSMLAGFSRLPTEEQRHAREIRSAELELKALVEHSKTMLLPERITERAKLESAILKGSDLNFLIKKQAARVKTKTKKKAAPTDRDCAMPLSSRFAPTCKEDPDHRFSALSVGAPDRLNVSMLLGARIVSRKHGCR